MKTERAHWRKLDTAAKIFPSTSSRKDTRVFRFYCVLKETIDGESLQKALDHTLEKYPVFLSVIRKGVFWYYLEKSTQHATVKEECDPPCMHLYIREKKSLLFQVTYYHNRINFEVFHALTDGTGAIEFLKELVKQYLLENHPNDHLPDINLASEDLTLQDQESDSFAKYYQKPSKESKKISDNKKEKQLKKKKDKVAIEEKVKACQLEGTATGYGHLNITEGIVSTSTLVQKAKEYHVSITVYLTAVFLLAIHQEMEGKNRELPAILMVPVNLRKYYQSSSMLNFFEWINPRYNFGTEEASLEKIIPVVSEYFKNELTMEKVQKRMISLASMERHTALRLIPLGIKSLGMLIAMKFGKKNTSAIFSNLGVVSLPDAYMDYIEYFGVFTSTPKTELSICSFQDQMTLSFATNYQEKNVERNFFRILKENGIESRMLEGDYPTPKKHEYVGQNFFKWFSFSCIAAAVIAVIVNLVVTPHQLWSVFTIAGAFCMWLSLAIGFYRRYNLLKNAVWQQVITSVACILWDYFTGWRGWSLDYAFPGICLVILLSLFILTKVFKYSVQEYMIYYIIASVIGLTPGILYLVGLNEIAYLALPCMGISFLFLTALLIFKRKDMFTELYKKFHI